MLESIKDCILEAKKQGLIVWVPAGETIETARYMFFSDRVNTGYIQGQQFNCFDPFMVTIQYNAGAKARQYGTGWAYKSDCFTLDPDIFFDCLHWGQRKIESLGLGSLRAPLGVDRLQAVSI